MSDDWGLYFDVMDGHTASILFDDGIAEHIDSIPLDHALKIRIPLREWNDAGLTTDAEAQRLNELEHELEAFISGSGGILLGRITVDRVRWVAGLVKGGRENAETLAGGLQSAALRAGYELECRIEPDPEKTVYWYGLYPNDDSRQLMNDIATLDQLSEHGDHGHVARPIQHWVYFTAEADAESFQAWAGEHGYGGIRIEPADEDEDAAFCVRLVHEGEARLNEISRHTIALSRTARSLNGRYDGWETEVVRK